MRIYNRIFFIIIFLISYTQLQAFGDDYLFYKCTPQKVELKSMYFYTQNEQINKFSTIQALEKSGYQNFGSSHQLLIKNKNGWFVSTQVIKMECKLGAHTYQITVGSVAGNPNPMGQCGAFSSHWVMIAKDNKMLLPKTILESCSSQSAISDITVGLNGKVNITRTNPFSSQSNLTNKSFNLYMGKSFTLIATDKFGNIWLADYQDRYILKINQTRIFSGTYISAHPISIASDSIGNVFVLAENGYVFKLDQKERITAIFKTLSNPGSIFIDPYNNIWVDSWQSGRLLKLNEKGVILNSYETGAGDGAGKMVMDKAGDLWITMAYAPLEILYPNGYFRKCQGIGPGPIATYNNTAWIKYGDLLENNIFLKHINFDCRFLPQAYKLDIQPEGLAIDKNGNIWVSGNKLYGGGVLEKLNEGVKHVYSIGRSAGPMVIDKYGNIWIISGKYLMEFTNLTQYDSYENPQQNVGLNPHLPIGIKHRFPEQIGH